MISFQIPPTSCSWILTSLRVIRWTKAEYTWTIQNLSMFKNSYIFVSGNQFFLCKSPGNIISQTHKPTTSMNGNTILCDIKLQQYVDQVMIRYDYDRSGTLEAGELVNFFNDLYQMHNIPIRVNYLQVQQMMRQIDTNFDGRANKFELFKAFKMMIAQNNNICSTAGSYQDSWNPNFHGNSRPCTIQTTTISNRAW